ncbi:MAG TPA: 50S ribosomal protein L6 [Acidimicrobiales bacterium]|jgi:large subunit ribosomal protein L6|nr:50S ribosomal protein L6 [Acidimicrobiales bacterium]
MSRIGRNPITVPSGVEVSVAGDVVTVKGPQATMSRTVPSGITLDQEGDTLVVSRESDETAQKALHGLTRTLVSNMVVGVTQGWSKELEIIGVGYRASAGAPGVLDLALGFSHPVRFTAPEGVTFEVPTPTRVIIKGPDKEIVGQVAANIRKLRKPEPYKGKGVRYLGERVARKAGKAAK